MTGAINKDISKQSQIRTTVSQDKANCHLKLSCYVFKRLKCVCHPTIICHIFSKKV